MKKIFTLIAAALMAVSANAQTDATVYNFGGITADKITVDENGEKYSRAFDGVDCPAVKYIGAEKAKMNITISGMDLLTMNYSNSSAKAPAITFAADFANVDTKNFVFILGNEDLKLKEGDVVKVKFAAKGSTEATIHAETNVIGDDAVSTAKDDIKVAEFTVEANGTCKVKETTGGVRIYAIAINSDFTETTTGISEVAVSKSDKVVKTIENGRLVIKTANGTFTASGARVK